MTKVRDANVKKRQPKALKGRRLLAVGKTHRHHFKQNPLFQNKNATIQSFSTNYLLLIAEF